MLASSFSDAYLMSWTDHPHPLPPRPPPSPLYSHLETKRRNGLSSHGRAMSCSKYTCQRCGWWQNKSEAYLISHIERICLDWQGHRRYACRTCSNEDGWGPYDEGMWKWICKHRWRRLEDQNAETEQRVRTTTFSHVRRYAQTKYPEYSQAELRTKILQLIILAKGLAVAVERARPVDRLEFKRAFARWDAEWVARTVDPEFCPSLGTFCLSDHALQWASELAEGLDEYFICRNRDCLQVSRNTDWLIKGDGQYGCPCCWRKYAPWTAKGNIVKAPWEGEGGSPMPSLLSLSSDNDLQTKWPRCHSLPNRPTRFSSSRTSWR